MGWTPCGSPGFTLTELLVASVILVILSGLVFSIASNMTRVWHQASGQLGAQSMGELALERLAQDIEAAVLGDRRRNWMQVELDNGIGEGNLLSPSAPHLMFFCHEPGSGGAEDSGGIAAVSYRLGFRDPFQPGGVGNFPRFALYRAVMPPAVTFRQAMRDEIQEDLKERVWDQTQAAIWGDLSGDGRGLAPRSWSLDTANLLASQVVEWRLVLHYADERGDPRRVRLGPGPAEARSLLVGPTLLVDGESRPYQRLLALEAELMVLTGQGARMLEELRQGMAGGGEMGEHWERVLRNESEIVSRRIAFLPTSL